jgi:hypothetical protein
MINQSVHRMGYRLNLPPPVPEYGQQKVVEFALLQVVGIYIGIKIVGSKAAASFGRPELALWRLRASGGDLVDSTVSGANHLDIIDLLPTSSL